MSVEWDFYFCQVENHPASIFVDLGIREDVPLADLGDVAFLRVRIRQPRADGLPGKEEYDRVSEIEDAVLQTLSNAKRKIMYVGRNTSNGRRDFYFYAANGIQVERLLTTVMGSFAEYEFEVGSRSDREWRTYREFLYPSPRGYQAIMNRRVLIRLEKHGDHHDIEREVMHWIYFQSREDRARFLAAAIQRGYKVVSQNDDGKDNWQFKLTVSKLHAVDVRTINDVVLGLFDLAGECAGDYDGWETRVEKGE